MRHEDDSKRRKRVRTYMHPSGTTILIESILDVGHMFQLNRTPSLSSLLENVSIANSSGKRDATA